MRSQNTICIAALLLSLGLAVVPVWSAQKGNLALQANGSLAEGDSYYMGVYQHSEPLLIDGIRENDGLNPTCWASEETPDPHWIRIYFPQESNINRVRIYWGNYNNRFWTSRHFFIQSWEDKGWRNVLEVKDNKTAAFTEHVFPSVETSLIRLWQPVGGGPPPRVNLMWVGEVEVYAPGQEPPEVMKAPEARFDQEISLEHAVINWAAPARAQVVIENRAKDSVRGQFTCDLENDQREPVGQGIRKGIQVPGGGKQRVEIPITVAKSPFTKLRLYLRWQSAESFVNRKYLLITELPPRLEAEYAGAKLRLVDAIDCTQDLPESRYCDNGTAKVVDSPIGKYREAGEKTNDRFAYRFAVDKLNTPHFVMVEYPDDKMRTMEILLTSPLASRSGDIDSGAFTGGEFPVTNQFHRQYHIFWPLDHEQAVTLMTCGTGQPAAARRIEVYEVVGGLPTAQINSPSRGEQRLIGLQWEDASINRLFGAHSRRGMATMTTLINNLTDYLKWTGQNFIQYPLWFYHGPCYPSQVEPTTDASVGWGRYRGHAADEGDWVEMMLEKFDEEGLYFLPSLTLLDMPSVRAGAVVDDKEVQAGKATYNQVLFNNGIRSTSGLIGQGAKLYPGLPNYGPGPAYNPLHPKVQQAILRLVDEILDRYGGHPSFRGISLNLWSEAFLWFGSLESGYGDFTVEMFEKDTGIKIPVEANDPQRFAKRYRWLMAEAKEPWLHWRCRKVGDFLMEIYRHLQQKRPGLKLVLSSWVPYPSTDSWPRKPVAGQWGLKRWRPDGQSLAEIHWEGGIDLAMFRGKPNIVIERVQVPCHYRKRVVRKWEPETVLSRDIDFDPQVMDDLRNGTNTSLWFYNSYYENPVGGRNPLPGFWWRENAWRVSAVTPAHRYFMEHYAHGVAELNATTLTNGGITLVTSGHDDQVREFAQAFRALPAAEFKKVEFPTDPVQVRDYRDQDRYYLCLTNWEYYPVTVRLNFGASGGKVQIANLATGEPVRLERGVASIEVRPYQLIALGAPPSVSLASAQAVIPPEQIARLRDLLVRIEAELPNLEGTEQEIADYREALAKAKAALTAKRYSEAHYLAESYPIQRLLRLH